jgi:hypothetical protein
MMGVTPGLMNRRIDPDGNVRLEQLTPDAEPWPKSDEASRGPSSEKRRPSERKNA